MWRPCGLCCRLEERTVPALEILAAALLVFGSALVFRALIEADQLLESPPTLETQEAEGEEARPLRKAA